MARPRVWIKYEAEKDGKKYNISIQEVTEDLIGPIADHMITYFLPREMICKSIGLKDDPESVSSFRKVWHDVLKRGHGLVAILEGSDPAPSFRIIGANPTVVFEKGKGPDYGTLEGEQFQLLMKAMGSMAEGCDIYGKYGVDRYLGAFGLSVHPEFHGLKLGQKILEAREPLCKANGISVTATLFSACHVAEKAGFDVVEEWECNKYVYNGKIAFPNASGRMAMMTKVYEL